MSMLIYLDQAMKELHAMRLAEGKPFTRADLNEAIMVGAVERVRPKMMAVVAIMGGLIPIMWSTGTGSEVMRRIAARREVCPSGRPPPNMWQVPCRRADLWRELRQPLPVETDAVAGPRRRRCHALMERERVLDIAVQPEAVRFQI